MTDDTERDRDRDDENPTADTEGMGRGDDDRADDDDESGRIGGPLARGDLATRGTVLGHAAADRSVPAPSSGVGQPCQCLRVARSLGPFLAAAGRATRATRRHRGQGMAWDGFA